MSLCTVELTCGFMGCVTGAASESQQWCKWHPDSACLACRRGEELLRKRCGLDSPKPSVNLEDHALLDKLFHLFQGSAGTDAEGVAGGAEGVPPQDDWVMPAGVLLQSRIMSLFTKSLLAANHFPGTVQVIP